MRPSIFAHSNNKLLDERKKQFIFNHQLYPLLQSNSVVGNVLNDIGYEQQMQQIVQPIPDGWVARRQIGADAINAMLQRRRQIPARYRPEVQPQIPPEVQPVDENLAENQNENQDENQNENEPQNPELLNRLYELQNQLNDQIRINNVLNNRNIDYANNKRNMEQEIQRLQLQLNANNEDGEIQRQMEGLQQQIQQITVQKDDMQIDLDNKNKRIENMTKVLTQSQNELQQNQDEINDLKQQLNDAQTQKNEDAQLQINVNDLEDENKKLKMELEYLRAEYEDATKEKQNQWELDKQMYEEQIKILKDDLEIEKEAQKLKLRENTEFEKLQSDLNAEKLKNKTLQKSIENKEKQLKNEIENYKQDISDSNKQIRDINIEKNKLEKEKNDILQKLNDTTYTVNQLTNEINTIKQKTENQNQDNVFKLNELNKEINNLKNERQTLQQQLQTLQNDIPNVENVKQQYINEITGLTKLLQDAQNKLDFNEAQMTAKFNRDLKTLEQQHKTELKNLETKYNSKYGEINVRMGNKTYIITGNDAFNLKNRIERIELEETKWHKIRGKIDDSQSPIELKYKAVDEKQRQIIETYLTHQIDAEKHKNQILKAVASIVGASGFQYDSNVSPETVKEDLLQFKNNLPKREGWDDIMKVQLEEIKKIEEIQEDIKKYNSGSLGDYAKILQVLFDFIDASKWGWTWLNNIEKYINQKIIAKDKKEYGLNMNEAVKELTENVIGMLQLLEKMYNVKYNNMIPLNHNVYNFINAIANQNPNLQNQENQRREREKQEKERREQERQKREEFERQKQRERDKMRRQNTNEEKEDYQNPYNYFRQQSQSHRQSQSNYPGTDNEHPESFFQRESHQRRQHRQSGSQRHSQAHSEAQFQDPFEYYAQSQGFGSKQEFINPRFHPQQKHTRSHFPDTDPSQRPNESYDAWIARLVGDKKSNETLESYKQRIKEMRERHPNKRKSSFFSFFNS